MQTYTIEWTNDSGEVRKFTNESEDNMLFLFGIAMRMNYFPVVSQN